MSPRNRDTYLADRDRVVETIRARAIWEFRRRHVTADRGALCDDVRAARLDGAFFYQPASPDFSQVNPSTGGL